MGITQLRKSLYMALVMAVVAGLALATATYAWFVNNAEPSLQQIQFSSTSSTNLSIAVHKDGATVLNQTALNYKGILDNTDVKDYLDIVHLKAVSSVDTAQFYSCDYFDEGGSNQAETFQPVADNSGFYLALPLWFKSTQAMDVYLKNNTWITAEGSDYSNYIDRALLLGFREDSDDSGSFSRSVVYEVNAAEDLPGRANTTAADYLGNPIGADKLGIKTVVTTLGADYGKISTTQPQARKLFNELAIAPVDGEIVVPLASIDAGKIPLFHIDPNQPKKITVYLWLDGMDYDCISAVSGGTLKVGLNFIGAEPR